MEANNQANCGSSVYTILSDGDDNRGWQPKIGYFEFNEAGLPYDAALHAALLSKIEQQAALSEQAERPLLLIVFIHGWLHNAANDDSNVVSFKELLQQVQADEDISEVGSRRNVVGLYIGWQAKSSSSDLVNLLSYKRKKELGIETGRASVTRLLEQLYDIRQKNERNRMVSVGHSFGGGLLFSATREQLIGAAMSETGTQRKAYSDLVVLVNPAMEAKQFEALQDAIQGGGYPLNSTLAMASFTSEADSALGIEFPAGMSAFYADGMSDLKGVDKIKLGTPYGLFYNYVGYKLENFGALPENPALTPDAYSTAAGSWCEFRSGTGDFNLGGAIIRKTQDPQSSPSAVANWSPILNVRTTAEFLPEHSDIWGSKFQYVLRGLIGVEFSRHKCQ